MVADTGPGAPLPASDVVLYDVLALQRGDGGDLAALVGRGRPPVVAMAQDLRPQLAARARALGARVVVPTGVDGPALVGAVESALAPELPVPRRPRPRPALGGDVRLTRREVDVLMRITWSYSNHEIADDLGLSANSVKTYIRSAYRRIAVTNRTRAVVWCLHHGFPAEPDPSPWWEPHLATTPA